MDCAQKLFPKKLFILNSTFLLLFLFFLLIQNSYAENSIRLNTTGQPPLNSKDKNGFMDRVAQQAFAHINIRLKTTQLPAERGLINANSGLEDGEMSRINGLTKTYPNLIPVPEKIMDWEFVAFSKKDINLDKGWNSLANHSVALINGWKILENNVPKSSDIVKVKNPTQLFSLLERSRTDVVLFEKWGGLALIKKKNLKGIRLISPILAKREMHIYLHKKHHKLIDPLNKALIEMKSNGQYQDIYNKILTPLISQ